MVRLPRPACQRRQVRKNLQSVSASLRYTRGQRPRGSRPTKEMRDEDEKACGSHPGPRSLRLARSGENELGVYLCPDLRLRLPLLPDRLPVLPLYGLRQRLPERVAGLPRRLLSDCPMSVVCLGAPASLPALLFFKRK